MSIIWAMLVVAGGLLAAVAVQSHTLMTLLTGVLIGMALATVFLTGERP